MLKHSKHKLIRLINIFFKLLPFQKTPRYDYAQIILFIIHNRLGQEFRAGHIPLTIYPRIGGIRFSDGKQVATNC